MRMSDGNEYLQWLYFDKYIHQMNQPVTACLFWVAFQIVMYIDRPGEIYIIVRVVPLCGWPLYFIQTLSKTSWTSLS